MAALQMPAVRWALGLALWLLGCAQVASALQEERNNWAVLVETSRYWYNYRHTANILAYYRTIKRLGIPDNQIITMVAEDMPCNSRNAQPGTIIGSAQNRVNLYGEEVEVDYRGDEVSVENFLRLLTGRHPPNTPRNKRLLTDSMSNIFIFITGHSGDEFIKFQDWEEISSTDIADAFAQMHKQRRYKNIFWLSDTCQAATLQNQFYSPGVIGIGSSAKDENSYSHHVDHILGIAVIDRFSYYALDYMERLTPASKQTLQGFHRYFRHEWLNANVQMRSDLYPQAPSDTLITEFFASTGRMRFQSNLLELRKGAVPVAGANGTCLLPAVEDLAAVGFPGLADISTLHASTAGEHLWQQIAAAVPGMDLQTRQRAAATFQDAEGVTSLPPLRQMGVSDACPEAVAWLLGFAAITWVSGKLL